jgi:hypothetical protein
MTTMRHTACESVFRNKKASSDDDVIVAKWNRIEKKDFTSAAVFVYDLWIDETNEGEKGKYLFKRST